MRQKTAGRGKVTILSANSNVPNTRVGIDVLGERLAAEIVDSLGSMQTKHNYQNKVKPLLYIVGHSTGG